MSDQIASERTRLGDIGVSGTVDWISYSASRVLDPHGLANLAHALATNTTLTNLVCTLYHQPQ